MSTEDQLEIKAGIQILKPVAEVFDAIVDPDKMKNYFIAKSTGMMEEGSTVTWAFPEMTMEFPVRVGKIKKDEYISFFWKDMDGVETQTEITLKLGEAAGTTFVAVTEKSRDSDKAGIKWLKGNTEGWANFLACLKAYLEYGINLRKGAFMKSQMPEEMS